jgi:hypothetical protein
LEGEETGVTEAAEKTLRKVSLAISRFMDREEELFLLCLGTVVGIEGERRSW